MPHRRDAARLRAVHDLLDIPYSAIPRTSSGLPALDSADAGQQRFQAALFTCLMSSSVERHVWEHPMKPALASVSSYVNWIIPYPDRVDLHTNTACRVASRLMPLQYGEDRISGIPGLRLIGYGKQRLRLLHLPTGGHLDLVDTHACSTRRGMGQDLRFETRWHHKPAQRPLWQLAEVTPEEQAHHLHWATEPCTALRSSLLIRAIWMYWELNPSWRPAVPAGGYEQLLYTKAIAPQEVADLLTVSEVRIPGVTYESRGTDDGVLRAGGTGITLTRVRG
ncbi:hypothetical protein ACIBI4_04315 [Streptomyces sp. NPDC050418]|uniref:hypothetical protein n=1 Tax=Streptomyces sp. NPDC050418 TaxID=3365612 RepID=UPI00378EE3DF